MQLPRDKVTANQLAISLISTVIGVNVFVMPRFLAENAGRDGWLSIILGGGLVMLMAVVLAYLGSRFPGETPVLYLPKVLGNFLGYALALIIVVFFIMLCGLVVRSFGDITKVYLLSKTPLEVIVLSMLFSAAYLVNHGVNALVRVIQIFFPLLVIPIVILIVMLQGMADFNQMLPVLADGPWPVFKGGLNGYAIFTGYGVIVFLIPFMEQPYQALKASALGILVPLLIYLITFILTIANFGPEETLHSLYPVVDLIREIEVPGGFVERFDLFLLSLWILTVFVTVAAAYYVAVLGFSQLISLKEERPLVYLMLPVIYLIAMRPRDFGSVEQLGFGMTLGSISLSVIMVLVLLLVIIKKQRGEIDAGQD